MAGVKLSGVLAEAMERIGRCSECRDLTEHGGLRDMRQPAA